MQCEDSCADDAGIAGFEETTSEDRDKLLTKLCVVDRRRARGYVIMCVMTLCVGGKGAPVEDKAIAEFLATIVSERPLGNLEIERMPMIEIGGVPAAAATATATETDLDR